ncbi:MAG: hypothetical protein LBV19_05040 [Streptococcaceae bacterium]|nr:hypothetical protein [Streptococcaceae bacterium]
MKKRKIITAAVSAASVLMFSGFLGKTVSANTTVNRYYFPEFSGRHDWVPLNGRAAVPTKGLEGRAWTVPDSGTEVYELLNPNTWDTLLTTSPFEANQVSKAGWLNIVSGSSVSLKWAFHSGGSVSIYRLYNPDAGKHFYTASTFEKNSLVSAGWRLESSSVFKALSGV